LPVVRDHASSSITVLYFIFVLSWNLNYLYCMNTRRNTGIDCLPLSYLSEPVRVYTAEKELPHQFSNNVGYNFLF